MKTFHVYAIIDASKYAGFIHAKNKEEAIEQAESSFNTPSLCHHCAQDVDLGDVIRFEVEETE